MQLIDRKLFCSKISVGSFIFSVYRLKYIEKKFDEYIKKPNKYISLDFLAFWEQQYNNFIAICVFLVWIKIFKYISFNKTMLQFCITLKRVSIAILKGKQKKEETFILSSYFSVCQRSLRIWFYVLYCFHCICSARLHIIRNG